MIGIVLAGTHTGAETGALQAAGQMGLYSLKTDEENILQTDATLMVCADTADIVFGREKRLQELRQLCTQIHKPYWTIEVLVGLHVEIVQCIARWIRRYHITVLNVTGSTTPAVQEFTQKLVTMLLQVKEEDI